MYFSQFSKIIWDCLSYKSAEAEHEQTLRTHQEHTPAGSFFPKVTSTPTYPLKSQTVRNLIRPGTLQWAQVLQTNASDKILIETDHERV